MDERVCTTSSGSLAVQQADLRFQLQYPLLRLFGASDMGDAGAALGAEGVGEMMRRKGLYEGHAENAVGVSSPVSEYG